jgi:hypothetical protein
MLLIRSALVSLENIIELLMILNCLQDFGLSEFLRLIKKVKILVFLIWGEDFGMV